MNSQNKGELRRALRFAFPHTIPVLTGFLVLGVAYGILMSANGYGTLWSTLMSTIAFCGSMQYAAITLLTSAFDPFGAFIISIMVNARHLFYGLSMLSKYKGIEPKVKSLLIFLLCDETFSISSSVEPPPSVNKKYFYLCISLLDYFYWVAGTFLGGVLGSVIKINTEGLDFVLTALFVVLFLEQIKDRDGRISGAFGIGCTVICLLIFGAENLVLPAMGLILIALLGGRKLICR